ncbi:MAG TPA: DUF6687 family protein [Pyrinomonadaceae bacterium]|jgi:hypothetical protein|nr:DUF6687 family protein [Pyrinomonadaceae bacterium]
MRFEYYHAGLDAVPKLSVDGTVSNSIHFSHWQGNRTPVSVKADTSTEIALNLVGSPDRRELTGGIELVTNNHFDTDGVLSVWTMLNEERALALRERLIAAAEAGDFSEYTTDAAVRASIVIQGSDQAAPSEEEPGSPLANQLAGETLTDDARAYALVLPEVERVLTRTGDYEPLWRGAWTRIAAALESFARGDSRVVEDEAARLSIITLAPALFSPKGFDAARHTVPFTAISHHARGQLFLIAAPAAAGGWSYRVDYPYYSWAETVSRPGVVRRDFAALLARLNELERGAAGAWRADTSELASAFKFMDGRGTPIASSLAPERVAEEIRAALVEANAETRAERVGGAASNG